ncbi:MAG: LysM peptidoglycan-binding domain-containing protein [Nibricoccus sp.]
MKILKILGIVVAAHAALFMFVFAIPGCRTTSRPSTPQTPTAETGAAPATVSFPGAGTSSGDVAPTAVSDTTNAGGSPTVSFNTQRYNPTRPGSSEASILQSGDVSGVTPASTYKIQSNDSLWKVAKKFGIGVDDLAKANSLKPDSPLKVGHKLIIPSKAAKNGPAGTRTYTVKSGDSLGSIARRNSTTAAELRALNPELKNDVVRVGQSLVLPASGKSNAAAAASAPAAPVISAASVTPPAGSIEHVVKPGEGLQQISRKYGVPQREIATANNITNPASIRVGQKLVIPGVKTPEPAAPAPAAEPAPVAPVAPSESPVAPAPEANPVAPAGETTTPPTVKVDESGPVSPAQ